MGSPAPRPAPPLPRTHWTRSRPPSPAADAHSWAQRAFPPYREEMTQMVDWDLAVATAATVTSGGPRVSVTEAADVVNELRRLTDIAERHVAAYTGLSAQVEHPPVLVVDRPDWVRVNIQGLQVVMDPVIEKLQAAQSTQSAQSAKPS